MQLASTPRCALLARQRPLGSGLQPLWLLQSPTRTRWSKCVGRRRKDSFAWQVLLCGERGILFLTSKLELLHSAWFGLFVGIGIKLLTKPLSPSWISSPGKGVRSFWINLVLNNETKTWTADQVRPRVLQRLLPVQIESGESSTFCLEPHSSESREQHLLPRTSF